MMLHIDQLSVRNARLILNRLGLRRHRKVFAIGFNKSGTTSLHALFETLGLVSHHGVRWRNCTDLALLKSYDCFSDDIPTDLARLDRLFPGAKFILQVRELDTWVYSRLAHIDRGKRNKSYKTHSAWDVTEASVKTWIAERNAYHHFVLSYFSERREDLLIVNFIRDPGAAVEVCKFLDYDDAPVKPAKNVNPHRAHPTKYKALLQKCITDLGVSEVELHYDILCPSLLLEESTNYLADSSMLKMRDGRPNAKAT